MNIQANSSAKPRVNWLSFPIVGWKGDAAAACQTSARGLDMVQLGCECSRLPAAGVNLKVASVVLRTLIAWPVCTSASRLPRLHAHHQTRQSRQTVDF